MTCALMWIEYVQHIGAAINVSIEGHGPFSPIPLGGHNNYRVSIFCSVILSLRFETYSNV